MKIYKADYTLSHCLLLLPNYITTLKFLLYRKSLSDFSKIQIPRSHPWEFLIQEDWGEV